MFCQCCISLLQLHNILTKINNLTCNVQYIQQKFFPRWQLQSPNAMSMVCERRWEVCGGFWLVSPRVSYETSFDSKQPKLEPKLVSTLSETRCLFRLFRFYIETASFGVSIEPKQNRNNRNKPKKVNLVAEYCTFTSKISKSWRNM
jgi:hypothetical protein